MKTQLFTGVALVALLQWTSLASAVHIPPGQVIPPVTNEIAQTFNQVAHDIALIGPGQSFPNRVLNSFNLLNNGDVAGACSELNSLIRAAEHEFAKGTISEVER
jgi:hypothetical protein